MNEWTRICEQLQGRVSEAAYTNFWACCEAMRVCPIWCARGPERASFAERDRACRVATLRQAWTQDTALVVAELLDQRFLEPKQ